MRHKVMGHKDATPAKGEDEPVNVVVVRISAQNTDLTTINFGEMTEATQNEICSLCDFYVAECITRLDPVMKRYLPEIRKRPHGWYQFCLTEPPHEWIKLFDRFPPRFED